MHVQGNSESRESAAGLRIGIALSRYHEAITQRLFEGARRAFLESGGREENLIRSDAAGAFELPVIAAALADREEIDGVVALGCIIAGETNHDEVIAHAVAGALAHLSLEARKPVALGLLTCADMDQAAARAGGDKGNKGADAMHAAIAAVHALRAVESMRLRRKAS